MIFNVNSGAGKIPINTVPDTNSSFTYDGTTKTPLWQNYDPQQLSISGNTAGTNAGTYKVYFTPKSDFEWWAGTSTPKEVIWSISKAAGSLSLSATSGTITGKYGSPTPFTVAREGDGRISVFSHNSDIATVTLSGTTVTVTAHDYGSATITVSVEEGTNYTAPGDVTYAATVDYLWLYKNGDENITATGGWKSSAISSTTKITKDATSMTIKTDYGDDALYCAQMIDLTSYQTLIVDGKSFVNHASAEQRAGNSKICVWSKVVSPVSSNRVAYLDYPAAVKDGEVSLDVSNLSGSYYVGVFAGRYYSVTVRTVRLQ